MKRIARIFAVSMIAIALLVSAPGCDPEDPILDQALGWAGLNSDYGDDLSTLQDDITFGQGQGELPASVNLSPNFPPIGDQGQYGTCVAWATGYNHRSYLMAKAENRTSFNSSQMFSPKYLFWAVPYDQKGADCNGTGFEPAFDVMLSKGIATLQTVPYTDLGNCSGSTSSWDGAASSFKIQSYREIDIDVQTLKSYLAQERPISFGAKLGDNFMSWGAGDDVLYSDTYGYSGQHAYHAMILAGYDDNRGNNGAFKVINSWGNTWGNSGVIWVDYNFFVSGNFCFCAFVASGADNPDPDGDNNAVVSEGTDLTAWEFELETNVDGDPLKYNAHYNVFNTGTNVINATNNWNILLIYYNATDAEDWGILLYDYYTEDYGTNPYPNNNGAMPIGEGDGMSNWWNYVNVQSGHSVAYDLYYPDSDEGTRFQWTYNMNSDVTGDYYLVIIADGYDQFAEVDEDNNYFFFGDVNGDPINFVNGQIVDNIPQYSKSNRVFSVPTIGQKSISPTARNERNLNAYTPQEIMKMIKYHRETGVIAQKVAQYNKSNVGTKMMD
jgi:hypothetical protein